MNNEQFWLRVGFIFVLSIFPASVISSAYAAQLSAIGLVTPKGAFQVEAKSRKDLGKTFEVNDFIKVDSFTGKTVTKKAPLVVNSESFLSRWVETVNAHKNTMLWSAYPAAIRGQVFSNSPPGGNPFESGGW